MAVCNIRDKETFFVVCARQSMTYIALPDQGLMAVFMGRRAGGSMARRLLPAVIGMPFLLGWLSLVGQRAGMYNTEVGVALFAVANVSMFAPLLWWNARLLSRSD